MTWHALLTAQSSAPAGTRLSKISSAPTRTLLLALAIGTAALCPAAVADLEPNHARVGVLTPPVSAAPEEGLREGLSRLGYVEGRNLTIEFRRADSDETLRSAALALVQSKVDVIVTFGTPAARAALAVTSHVPVVFISGDPLSTGLAASLARPGANATGVATLSIDLIPKRLELLKEVAPRVRRILLLGNPDSALHHAQVVKHAKIGAAALQLQLVTLDARNVDELEAVLRGLHHDDADALMASPDVLFLANKSKIAEALVKARLPAVVPWPDGHDAGVLMAYGASTKEMGRRAGLYAGRILNGAKPAELPVEQLSKYDLVIDLRVAKALGLKVPQELLLRADEVIR